MKRQEYDPRILSLLDTTSDAVTYAMKEREIENDGFYFMVVHDNKGHARTDIEPEDLIRYFETVISGLKEK